MKKVLYVPLLIIVMGLHTVAMKAQTGYDLHTDTLSLQLYEQQEWEELYKLVKTSVAQDISFYYLYIRGALAGFYTGRYSRANDLFKQAQNYKRGNEYIREIHYLSALYAQLPLSIESTYAALTPQLKERYAAPKYKALQYLGVLSGVNKNKDYDQLKNTESQGVYSDRILLKDIQFTDVYFGQQLSSRWRLNYTVERLTINKVQDAYTQNALTGVMDAHQQAITTKQWSYHLNAWFNVDDKLYLYPFFNVLSYQSNYLHIAYDENTYAYSTSNTRIDERQYLYGVGAKYRQQYVHWDISASRLATDRGQVYQSVLGASITPFKGKQHYLTAQWNRTFRVNSTDENFTHHVIQTSLGFNIQKSWLTLSYSTGNHQFMMDNYGATVYNTYEKIMNIASANYALPLVSNLWLSVNYKYLDYQSETYIADLTKGLYRSTFIHHNHSISGGLTWYF